MEKSLLDNLHKIKAELLYILGSNMDKKGRRVLVRVGIVENVIFPQDMADPELMSLIGLESVDVQAVRAFLTTGGRLP